MAERDTTGRPRKSATARDSSPVPARLVAELTATVVSATKESQRLRGKGRGTGAGSRGRREDPKQLRGELDRIRAEIERERHRHESGLGSDRTRPPPHGGGRRNADDVAMEIKELEEALEAMRREQEQAKEALDDAEEERARILAVIVDVFEALEQSTKAITTSS